MLFVGLRLGSGTSETTRSPLTATAPAVIQATYSDHLRLAHRPVGNEVVMRNQLIHGITLFVTVQLAVLALSGGVFAVAAQGIHESAIGHAEFVNPATGNRTRYSVSAIRHQDGTVSGEFEIHAFGPTGAFLLESHVAITGMTITGNIARIGGVVTETRGAGAPVGTEGFITIVDNGETVNDPPDLASPAGVGPGTATAHCTTGLMRPMFPMERGNIQVRPAAF
jgi:hypothetical protein